MKRNKNVIKRFTFPNKEEDTKMIAVNYSVIEKELEKYFDRATNEEEIFVVRRKDEKNVVLISLDMYDRVKNQLRW